MQQTPKTKRPAVNTLAGVALTLLLVLSGRGEQNHPSHPYSLSCASSSTQTLGSQYRAVRVIDDPGTGRLWWLVQNLDRPEGPALLAPIPGSQPCARFAFESFQLRTRSPLQNHLEPIIHPGDQIILSEETRTSSARLEATALQPAAMGAGLDVRLKIGGHILHAVATAPGHASLLVEENEGRK